ncbi:hypothetical protein BC829DRAFT_99706 [Chytridium lagenaria]|nr:hypothetical protein BC829DRAFT_99706 [Chytridium lagenaria]
MGSTEKPRKAHLMAFCFAAPIVIAILTLTTILNAMEKAGSDVDLGVFSAAFALMLHEVTVVAVGIKTTGMMAFVKTLPSFLLKLILLVAAHLVGTSITPPGSSYTRQTFLTAFPFIHFIAAVVWRYCFQANILERYLEQAFKWTVPKFIASIEERGEGTLTKLKGKYLQC